MGNASAKPAPGRFVALLPSEIGFEKATEPPITTVNFYKGIIPAQAIKKQAQLVLDANPWLAGHFAKDPATKQMGLLVPEAPVLDKHLLEVEEPELSSRSELAMLEKTLSKYMVNKGAPGYQLGDSLWQMTVVKLQEDEFCILLSMCHAMGDGHDFYAILNMLSISPAGKVKAMQVERVEDYAEYERQVIDVIGKERKEWFLSPPSVLNVVWNMAVTKTQTIYRYVNIDYIEEQKKKHVKTADIPFVSTNDIISSMISEALGLDCMAMAVDARGRVKHLLNDDMVGNYESPFFYLGEESKTPAGVRGPIAGKYPSSWKHVPSGWTTLCSHRTGIISSWATFHGDLHLPGCTELLHLPIFSKSLPSLMVFVWWAGKNKLALAIHAEPHTLKALESHPAIGDAVIE